MANNVTEMIINAMSTNNTYMEIIDTTINNITNDITHHDTI